MPRVDMSRAAGNKDKLTFEVLVSVNSREVALIGSLELGDFDERQNWVGLCDVVQELLLLGEFELVPEFEEIAGHGASVVVFRLFLNGLAEYADAVIVHGVGAELTSAGGAFLHF